MCQTGIIVLTSAGSIYAGGGGDGEVEVVPFPRCAMVSSSEGGLPFRGSLTLTAARIGPSDEVSFELKATGENRLGRTEYQKFISLFLATDL
jgi:hypothetical protein